MTLEELEAIVAARASASPDDSWTAKLLAKGPEKCAEKFGEEAVEAIIEAVKNDREKLTGEAADVPLHRASLVKGQRLRLGMTRAGAYHGAGSLPASPQ